jgi:hypothetical protein
MWGIAGINLAPGTYHGPVSIYYYPFASIGRDFGSRGVCTNPQEVVVEMTMAGDYAF